MCHFFGRLCARTQNCGLGGQAKLGAKLLLDYGFTNVKVIDGGCDAYLKEFPDDKPCTKKGG